MGSWRDATVLCTALAGFGCTVTAGDAVPRGGAENVVRGEVRRGGSVPGGTDVKAVQAAVEAAVRADAVRDRPGVDAASLRVEVEDVTWSDGSLGCPQPGLMYTQALVPGWRLVVRHAGQEAVYHASRRGEWLRCPPGRSQRPLAQPATR